MRAGLSFKDAERKWPSATRKQGPRELDIVHLLRNVRAREGERAWLTLVDGTVATCQANVVHGRVRREIRLEERTCPGHATGWMTQADALGWAITLDQDPRPLGNPLAGDVEGAYVATASGEQPAT